MGFEIAIDGPGGSGKSTIAKRLAAKLGFVYIDTGAMYRAVALFCNENGIEWSDRAAVEAALDDIQIDIKYVDGAQRVMLNGEDVTQRLRTAECGKGSSSVAVHGKVREQLVRLQRQLAQDNDVVMDGRDIATHVLPNAGVKIYLDASVEIRTQRRCNELAELGLAFDTIKIRQEIIDRDFRDTNRELSPLKKADDAVLIDASGLSPDEVEAAILEVIVEKRKDWSVR